MGNLPIVLVLAIGALLSGVPPVDIEERITPETLPELSLGVTFQTETRGDETRFRVTVQEKPVPSRFYLGSMKIRKEGRFVATCPAEPIHREAPSIYSFAVSSEYLSESDFELFVGVQSSGVAVPGGKSYLFNLKAFRDAGNQGSAAPERRSRRR